MSQDYKKYINAIKQIKDYDTNLDRQNLWWTVVAMVGKINNQGLEPQLLDSISATQAQFDNLKSQLINSLVTRYLEKVEVDLRLKGQSFIDILNRNLFERTADVGFLATDQDLVSYLQNADFSYDKRKAIETRLNEYVNKYTVYMDIALFTSSGELVASLSNTNANGTTSSQVVYSALKTEDYIEYDKPIDLVHYDETPLYYLQRVQQGNSVVGVLCMSFKFVDEMQRITQTVDGAEKGFQLALSNAQSLLFKSDHQLAFNTQLTLNNEQAFEEKKINNKEVFCYSCRASGYQGYMGLDWVSTSYVPLQFSFKIDEGQMLQKNLVQESALFPFDLYMLNLEINTALTIVVLNGKISSLKNKVKSFLPVLDYFQDIGGEVKEVFADSINHIHAVAHATMQEKVEFAANIALDVMDRNLYERANDCRWWALNPTIIDMLTQAPTHENNQNINNVLKYINELYTVYTVLYVYDNNGNVRGISNSSFQKRLGENMQKYLEFSSCMKLSSSQQYVVSKFEVSSWYDDRPTYVYHAVIKDENNHAIGGIGIVFDAEPEFKAILEDFLPKEADGSTIEGCFALFVDATDKIISATENAYGLTVGAKLAESRIPSHIFTREEGGYDGEIAGKNYIIACKKSSGYREYKNSDGYENDIYCYVFAQS